MGKVILVPNLSYLFFAGIIHILENYKPQLKIPINDKINEIDKVGWELERNIERK